MNGEISEEMWKVVEARVKASPIHLRILIFGNVVDQQGLLNEIENRTETGKVYALAQIEFLKWCARGLK